MPTVARISGSIRIEQYIVDHNPPHFHAVDGGDEVLIEIALPMRIVAGNISAAALSDVLDWAKRHRAQLALNWVDALARNPLQRIP